VPYGVPAASTAARQISPNAVRHIGRSASVTNTKPPSSGEYVARCAASASTATVGNGMLHMDAAVFGGARNGARPDRHELPIHEHLRRRKSIRSIVKPKHSPWRMPEPAAKITRVRYRSGAALANASTTPWPAAQSETLSSSAASSRRTDCVL
jgi:hypothetical protein